MLYCKQYWIHTYFTLLSLASHLKQIRNQSASYTRLNLLYCNVEKMKVSQCETQLTVTRVAVNCASKTVPAAITSQRESNKSKLHTWAQRLIALGTHAHSERDGSEKDSDSDSDNVSVSISISDSENADTNLHEYDDMRVGSKYQSADALERYLEKQTCCSCLPLRNGLLLLCVVLVVDSMIEVIAAFVYSLGVVAFAYALFVFVIGLFGLYSVCANQTQCVQAFAYLCIVNVVLQISLCAWLVVLWSTQWKRKVAYICIAVVDATLGVCVWRYFIMVIFKYHSILKHFYVSFHDS